MSPNEVELIEEFLVFADVSELPLRISIFLQRPIRRRSDDEMNALRLTFDGARIGDANIVDSRNSRQCGLNERGEAAIFGDARNIRLWIGQLLQLRWLELRQCVQDLMHAPSLIKITYAD
jgi:hypothetical protein